MLVIDLIEGAVVDDLFHVEELNDEHPVRPQRLADAVAHGVQFLEVKEDAGGVDRVKLLAQPQGRFAIEEGVERGNARLLRDPAVLREDSTPRTR